MMQAQDGLSDLATSVRDGATVGNYSAAESARQTQIALGTLSNIQTNKSKIGTLEEALRQANIGASADINGMWQSQVADALAQIDALTQANTALKEQLDMLGVDADTLGMLETLTTLDAIIGSIPDVLPDVGVLPDELSDYGVGYAPVLGNVIFEATAYSGINVTKEEVAEAAASGAPKPPKKPGDDEEKEGWPKVYRKGDTIPSKLVKLTKPKDSPSVNAWLNQKNGAIEIAEDGTWTYTINMDQYGEVSISYPKGYANFSDYRLINFTDANGNVQKMPKNGYVDIGSFDPKANRKNDYYKANNKVGLTKNTIPKLDAGNFASPEDYTWHHLEDGEHVIAVPRDIHELFKHFGGVNASQQNSKEG